MQFSMGYHPGTACCEIAIPPPPPPPPTPAPMANRAPTVSCDPETASIKAGEMVGLRANASDPDPNPSGVRMGGYQQLVRGEVMRGKFRNDLEQPQPFTPGEPSCAHIAASLRRNAGSVRTSAARSSCCAAGMWPSR